MSLIGNSKSSMEETFTLTGLIQKAAGEFPSRRALSVSGKYDLTYKQLNQHIEEAAIRLLTTGVKPGDAIALIFRNTAELVILFLAVLRVRAVAVPLNPVHTSDEFEFYLSDAETRLLFTSKEGNPAAEAAARKLDIPYGKAILPDPDAPISLLLTQSDSLLELDAGSVSKIVNEPSDVSLFLHTSGTTSRPKGVPLTQLNLASSVQNIKSVYKLTESDSTLLVLPLFHVHGLVAGLLSSLAAGSAVTLTASGRFSASAFWADIRAYGATWFTAVPTIHQILLDRHLSKPESDYPTLRFIRSCSASLPPAVLEQMESKFGAPVLEAYAMTEAAHLMASNPLPEDGPHKPSSVGKPVGQEMTILNENGVPQPNGTPGEVCIRGPNVTKGYKNNPEANKEAFKFGWFHTGDVGFMDEDGYLHLVGRIKELINRGGEKISPIEVDAVLLAHPAIAQAAAFGVPDEKYGEEIYCAVIPHAGSSVTEEEVLEHCKKNIASFKVPKKVFVTNFIPKTASGKFQRRAAAEHFLAKVSAPQ